MPIFASNFTSNSLSGVATVIAGNVTINLTPAAFALEGDRTFVVKLRKGSSQAAVIATSPVVTIKDRTTFVSLTANTATVAEGNLVAFSLVTTNVLNGATVYYSVLPATANVTADDFTGNTGSAVITNNAATFALKANADVSLVDETGENFKVQLRTNSPTGNVVFATSNVTILDTYKTYNVLSFVENVTSPIVEGSNVTFTFIATNIPNGTVLYYNTTGNTTSFFANTGSFVMNGTSNTFVISNPQIPYNTTRAYSAIVRDGSDQGPIIATSNIIVVVDDALVTMSGSGGVQSNISGYRVHTLTSNGTVSFNKAGTIEYLIVGGGGSYMTYGGGGAGGLLQGTVSVLGTGYTVNVGAKGFQSPNGYQNNGGNTTAFGFIAYGGGAGTNDGTQGGAGTQAASGGSGAGGGGSNGVNAGGGGFAGQGYPGGIGAPGPVPGVNGQGSRGGGGGGAGEAGKNAPLYSPSPGTGAGGNGIWTSITGSNVAYAGGGNSGYSGAGAPWGSSGYGAGGGNGTPAQDGVVIFRYSTNAAAFVNITTPANFVYEGSNIVFTMNTTDLSNNTLLYYYTVGNILSSHFVTGNTGSFRTTLNSTTITLQSNSTIPANEERFFQLRITGDVGTSQDPLITSNVFTVKDSNLQPKTSSIQYLVVAGGGGGGGQNGGGGGGAGGYLANSAYPITPATPYTITVGGGGAGAPGSQPPSYTNSIRGGVGGNSSIGAGVVSFGGGGGGTFYGAPLYNTGEPGGSGGAGHFSNETNDSSQPKVGLAIGSPGWNVAGSQGYPSGRSSQNVGPSAGKAGGGGGAGQTGSDGPSSKGGDGLQTSISGSATYYGGGGGGAGQSGVGAGGLGGGGSGPQGPGSSGSINTGGGGGGMGTDAPTGFSGSGGSGIVIIRYPDTFATATTTGSPNVIYANANIIYRFWQTGSITFP